MAERNEIDDLKTLTLVLMLRTRHRNLFWRDRRAVTRKGPRPMSPVKHLKLQMVGDNDGTEAGPSGRLRNSDTDGDSGRISVGRDRDYGYRAGPDR